MDKKIAEAAGLVEAGKDEEGNQLYIGTRKQWQEADRLEEKIDDMVEGEVEECLMSKECECEDCEKEKVWMDR